MRVPRLRAARSMTALEAPVAEPAVASSTLVSKKSFTRLCRCDRHALAPSSHKVVVAPVWKWLLGRG